MSETKNNDLMNSQVKVAFAWLFIAGLLGVLMRMAFISELPAWIDYRNILHTHSHIAMMGWIYSILYILIVKTFDLRGRCYNKLFWWTQISVLGMFVFFPIQGYGLGSIPFTTLHMILGYIFAFMAIKDSGVSSESGSNYPRKFLIMALLFMVLSTLGTWALGYMMAIGIKGSPIYYASIQFFLHFQFNGWFIFAIIAILLKHLQNDGLLKLESGLKSIFWTLVISCALTYALSITWSTPKDFIFYLNSLGVIIQFLALYLFYNWYTATKGYWAGLFNRHFMNLLKFSLLCLAFKIFIQTLVAIPALAVISYTIKNFVIGFIHLLMLGAVTSFALVFILTQLELKLTRLRIGLILFLAGFIGSEVLLFGQGIMLWQKMGFLPYYYHMLAFTSALMPIGFGYLLFRLKKI